MLKKDTIGYLMVAEILPLLLKPKFEEHRHFDARLR